MLEPRGELDLAEEAVGPERHGQLGVQHLERDRAVVLEVAGEEDGRHPAAAELALEGVAGAQAFLELSPQVGHARAGLEGVGSRFNSRAVGKPGEDRATPRLRRTPASVVQRNPSAKGG